MPQKSLLSFFLSALLGGVVGVCHIQEGSAQTSDGQSELARRIAHSDPSKYRNSVGVHGGAGSLDVTELFTQKDFNTNVIFVHRGVLLPKSSIGHHFHNQMEEMFVILDNRAQFTVDGRTAELTGPAAVPCRMGSSHGIYNPTNQPTQWMNIAVGSVRGRYDSYDLNDDRVGVPLDPRPVFMSVKMDKTLLKEIGSMNGGKGTIQFRRMFGPEVFRTNWGYVDHLLLPPGSSVGTHYHQTLEEIYYVMSGMGTAIVRGQTAQVGSGDAVVCRLGEDHGFHNAGPSDLELLVVGIALEKGKFDEKNVSGPELTKP